MVSPTLRNKSGFARRIVSNRRMPPRELSMPQPCPQVSADQASRTGRPEPGAVRNFPTSGALTMLGSEASSKRTR